MTLKKFIGYLKSTKRSPRLTIKGLTNNAAGSEQRKFDWCDAIIDGAIISGLTFFSTLGGGSVAGLEILPGLKAATIACCAQFFVFLALKRGIVKGETPN